MKKNLLSIALCLGMLIIFTGCESSSNNRNEFDNMIDTGEDPIEKVYTKITCEEGTYIDTQYYVYVKSGKYIASIEFDEETASVHSYSLSLELSMERSSTNDTLKKHAEEFNDYCNENNSGEFKDCTYLNYLEGEKRTVITGEYDLSKITNLPTSSAEAKTFLESRHGMSCTIK